MSNFNTRRPYKKNYNSFGNYSNTSTKVSIDWSNKSGAYAIKFHDTYHWDQMQVFLSYIKNFPMGERDYDPVGKIWYLIEQHIGGFIEMLKLVPQYFEYEFNAKPVGQTNVAKFVPTEVYLERFLKLSGENIKDLKYDEAKKIYRRVCLKNHPDRGGDPAVMSSINEAWSDLEMHYFNAKKETEYVIS